MGLGVDVEVVVDVVEVRVGVGVGGGVGVGASGFMVVPQISKTPFMPLNRSSASPTVCHAPSDFCR